MAYENNQKQRSDEELLEEILNDESLWVDEPMNFTADAPKEEVEIPVKQPKTKKASRVKATKAKEDRTIIALMIIASFLCLGIIGVMIYWLELLPA